MPQDRAYLIDVGRATAYPLDTGVTGVGRDPANRVVIDSPVASRFHAQLRPEAGRYTLLPTGSAATIVNGRPAEAPCPLDEGDEIEIADAVLRFTRAELPPGVHLAPEPAARPMTTQEIAARRRPTLRRSLGLTMELETLTEAARGRGIPLTLALLALLAALWVLLT
jgi:pSer/pThr/pTyr-binding forkhead associated (FHA) protein